MVLPSFLIIFAIASMLDRFLEIRIIASAFRGIKIAVGILILDAAVGMIQKMPKKRLPRVIMLCSFAAMMMISLFSWNFSSIALMLIAGAVSLGVFCMKAVPEQKGGAQK